MIKIPSYASYDGGRTYYPLLPAYNSKSGEILSPTRPRVTLSEHGATIMMRTFRIRRTEIGKGQPYEVACGVEFDRALAAVMWLGSGGAITLYTAVDDAIRSTRTVADEIVWDEKENNQ